MIPVNFERQFLFSNQRQKEGKIGPFAVDGKKDNTSLKCACS